MIARIGEEMSALEAIKARSAVTKGGSYLHGLLSDFSEQGIKWKDFERTIIIIHRWFVIHNVGA